MKRVCLPILFSLFIGTLLGQVEAAPDRRADEGEGPYTQLIIRGVTVIKGDGAPPQGPMDVVIENNRIESVRSVGYPGVPIDEARRPKLKAGGREFDAEGMYLLPGFVDMHGHIGGRAQGADAEYVFKLWMGHGITTIREPGSFNGLSWVLEHKKRSAANTIVAPRIVAYTGFGQGREEAFTSVEEVEAWVRENKEKGSDGIKFFGSRPEFMQAALSLNKELGLGSACHHAQLDVARWNVLNSAKAGLTTMEHWYGLPEALFADKTIQDYPVDYNYNNAQHRFGEAWHPQGRRRYR